MGLANNIKYFIMPKLLKLKNNPEKIRKLLELAGVKKDMRVLDYGCGIGCYSLEAGKIAGISGNIIAADISNKMLVEVRKRAKLNSISNIKPVLVESILDIKKNNDYDFILLIDVLHMISNKLEMINLLLTMLLPKGKLLIKFEHINKNSIRSLLNNIICNEKRLLYNDFWILVK